MEQISLKVGERLKEVRKTRGLTLDAVSEMTDVSKPMLGQIERGQSSPTINTLWKISTGLKIPLSFLCKQKGIEYTVAERTVQEMVTEENGSMRAYPLFLLTRCGMWRCFLSNLTREYSMILCRMQRVWRNIFFLCRAR